MTIYIERERDIEREREREWRMGDERVRGRLQIQWHQTGIHLTFYCAFGSRACGARLGFVAGKLSGFLFMLFFFLLGGY